MRFVLPVLAVVPFVSFLILRRYRKAAVYGMVYVLCLMLPMLLRQLDAPVFSIISGALAAIFTQMLPGLAMFDVLLSSTTVSEFIGGHGRLSHLQKVLRSGLRHVSFLSYNP